MEGVGFPAVNTDSDIIVKKLVQIIVDINQPIKRPVMKLPACVSMAAGMVSMAITAIKHVH